MFYFCKIKSWCFISKLHLQHNYCILCQQFLLHSLQCSLYIADDQLSENTLGFVGDAFRQKNLFSATIKIKIPHFAYLQGIRFCSYEFVFNGFIVLSGHSFGYDTYHVCIHARTMKSWDYGAFFLKSKLLKIIYELSYFINAKVSI